MVGRSMVADIGLNNSEQDSQNDDLSSEHGLINFPRAAIVGDHYRVCDGIAWDL